MARPPKLKWQKTVAAFESLFHALEATAAKTNAPVVGEIATARAAVHELREHVEESEECEMD